MNSYFKLALLLLTPLLLIAAAAVSIYGWNGPPDQDTAANKSAHLIGLVYGVYAVVTIVWFIRRRR